MSLRLEKNQKIVRIILIVSFAFSVLFAWLFHDYQMMVPYGIFSNMASAFGVVVILMVIYHLLGGEPLQKEVNELGRQVSKFKQINRVTNTALDAGLIEIFPKRQQTVDDEWRQLLASREDFPKDVDVLSMVMKPVTSHLQMIEIVTELSQKLTMDAKLGYY